MRLPSVCLHTHTHTHYAQRVYCFIVLNKIHVLQGLKLAYTQIVLS